LNGIDYLESGSFTQTLNNQNGCDSTLILELTVFQNDSTFLQQSLCEGDTFSLNGIDYFESGSFTQTLNNQNGCDSTLILNLTFLENFNTLIDLFFCEGDTLIYNGVEYTEAGIFTQALVSQSGCDSILTLSLMVNVVSSTNLVESICEGDTLVFAGNPLTAMGVYTENLTNTAGCDSTVTLALTVHPIFMDTLAVTINEGETFEIGTSIYDETGFFEENFLTVFGCDSTIFIDLDVIPLPSFCPTEICNGIIVPGDTPESTCIICDLQDLHGYMGNNANATLFDGPAGTFCGSLENNQFFAFVAPQSSVEFEITSFNCSDPPPPNGSGLQAEIYTSSNCEFDWTSVSNCSSNGVTGSIQITASNLIVGEVYYLMIDGWAGDICDYTIDVSNPIGGIIELPEEIIVSGPSCLFADSTVMTFALENTDNVYDIEWTVEGGTILQGINNEEVIVSFFETGEKIICANLNGICAENWELCTVVEITSTYEINESIVVCTNDPEIFCGGQLLEPTPTSDTTYQFQFTASNGCDSTLFCHVAFGNILVELEEAICADASFSVGDSIYNESGFYIDTLTSSSGCDSIINLNLTVFEELILVDTLILGTIAGEANGEISLEFDSDATPLSFEWSNGETTQNISNLEFGIYFLTVTDANNCVFEFEFEVEIILNTDSKDLTNLFRILPNPISGGESLTILHQNSKNTAWSFQLIDLTGRVLSETNTSFQNGIHQVEMPNVAGVYWVVLTSEKGIFSGKIIVY